MARLSFALFAAVVAILTLTEGRPNNSNFVDDEEYVNNGIVKKGDITKKEKSPKSTGKLVLLEM